MLLDVFLRVTHGLDPLGLFVRDLHPELFLEAYDQLDQVERVCVEILHERGLWFHVAFVDAELLDDDLLEPLVCVSLGQQLPPPRVKWTPPPPAHGRGPRKCHGEPSGVSIGRRGRGSDPSSTGGRGSPGRPGVRRDRDGYEDRCSRPPTAVASTPFTNFGEASEPNIFASSTASSMITPAGASPEMRSSYNAMRSTFRSMRDIWSIGNSGASVAISASSSLRCAITPSTISQAKALASSVKPARNAPRSQVSRAFARLKSISKRVWSARRRAGCRPPRGGRVVTRPKPLPRRSRR